MVMAQVYINGNSLCYKDDKINFIEDVGLRDEVIVDFADGTTIRFQNRARIVPPYTREWKIDIVTPPCDAAAIYLANERQHFDLYENLCVFLDLNLGYPACFLKNFLYAESKSLSED